MSKTMLTALLAAIWLIAQSGGTAQAQSAGIAIPDWYRQHVGYMTADGGHWVASNAEYESEAEPWEAYSITFSLAGGGTGYTAQLRGQRDGEASPVFWEFRGWWDPVAGEARLLQWGAGGAVGNGTLHASDTGVVADQAFASPGGPVRREGHDFILESEDVHITLSYGLSDTGEREPRRRYEWIRSEP